jgi:hypothetical protein
MKKQVALLVFLRAFQIFGQSISYLENTVMFSNPAATTKYKLFTSTSANFAVAYSNSIKFRYQIQARNYTKIQVKNFQFGAGFITTQSNSYRNGSFQLDANYTFNLTRFLNLTVGVGGRMNKFMFVQEEEGSNLFTGLNSGIMLEGRKWRAGVSYSNINRPEVNFMNDTNRLDPTIGLYGEYRFKINDDWAITPQIHIHGRYPQAFGFGGSVYYKKFQVGGTVWQNYFNAFAGYTFKEKYMIGLVNSFNFNYGAKPSVNTLINFSYIIPRKKEKVPPPLPSF